MGFSHAFTPSNFDDIKESRKYKEFDEKKKIVNLNIPFNSKKIVKTRFLKIMSIRRQKNTNTHFFRYLAINNLNLTRKNCKFYLPFREDENHVNSTKLRKVRKLQKNHPFLVATKLALLLRACASVFAHLFLSRWHNHNNS